MLHAQRSSLPPVRSPGRDHSTRTLDIPRPGCPACAGHRVRIVRDTYDVELAPLSGILEWSDGTWSSDSAYKAGTGDNGSGQQQATSALRCPIPSRVFLVRRTCRARPRRAMWAIAPVKSLGTSPQSAQVMNQLAVPQLVEWSYTALTRFTNPK